MARTFNVDVYDALTTDRPYRQALTPPEAFEQIRQEVNRGWWDAQLVGEVEEMIGEWSSVDAELLAQE